MHPFKSNTDIENLSTLDENISIVLTCHPEYLKYLTSCIDSINNQSIKPKQRVLVLDNIEEFDSSIYHAEEWLIVRGNWGHPNPARNAGLKECRAKWVIFFDADNIMLENYISSFLAHIPDVGENIAFLYKDILLKYNDSIIKHPLVSSWDYWKVREGNFIDTSSMWSVDAVKDIGGWDDNIQNEDDYNLVLRLSSKGWSGQYISSQPASMHISHNNKGRWSQNRDKIMNSLFNSYSFSIISLLSGRENVYNKWVEAIDKAVKPAELHWFLLDDSHDQCFSQSLKDLYKLDGFKSINIIKSPFASQDIFTSIDKHNRVAKLYNYVLTNMDTDFILTIEDDVIIPRNAIEDLFSIFEPIHMNLDKFSSYYGVVGGLYQSPSNYELAVAAFDHKKWENMPIYKDMFNKVEDVGFIGGGCSLWFNGVLQRVLPLQPKMVNGELYGWDSDACNKIRSLGYSICLNGNVICDHVIDGDKNGPIY